MLECCFLKIHIFINMKTKITPEILINKTMEIRELECGEYILLNHGKVIRRGTYELCLEIQLEYECIYAWANEMSNNL